MKLLNVIWMVIKQIIKNWKLEFIILLGLILAVGVFSSIFIYTDGVLQMITVEKWENAGTRNYPPGSIKIKEEQWRDYHPILGADKNPDKKEEFIKYKTIDAYLNEKIPDIYPTQKLYSSLMGRLSREALISEESNVKRYADIRFIDKIKEQAEIVSGRWYEETDNPGQVEVVIDENAMEKLDVGVGEKYSYPLKLDEEEEKQKQQYLELEIVGAFSIDEDEYNRPIWVSTPPFRDSMFVSQDKYEQLVQLEGTRPQDYEWYWLFDHRGLRAYQVFGMLDRLNRIETEVTGYTDNIRFVSTPITVLSSVREQAELIEKLLLILSLPVMGIIFYYIILSASLTIQRRGNEIAMLRSRGASILQIIFSYILEWGFLGIIALLIGPQLGLFIARAMGASAGFLEFVGRRPLPAIVTTYAQQFSVYTILAAIAACLVLVIPAARQSIVSYKQNIARQKDKPFWQRYYLDLVFVGFSIFSYQILNNQIESIQEGSESASGLMLDPLLFLVPVLFITTAGLLSLRIIPWIFRFLAYITRRMPEITLSMTLKHFYRDSAQSTPLLFFIIMTVSLGIYSSSIARTIDENFVDSQMYEQGAEVVLNERWSFGMEGMGMTPPGMPGGPEEGAEAEEETEDEGTEQEFFEPPFYVHKDLTGVNDAARVLTQNMRFEIGGSGAGNGTLMGIDPQDFARVSWFRSDLTEYHLHDYMNILLSSREAALVDREFFEENNLERGEWITLSDEGEQIEFYVAGIIDLWPTIYPDDFPLVVGNLDYIQSQFILQPYEIWLDVEKNTDLQTIVDELSEESIFVSNIQDTSSEIIEGRRDPQRMGLYGMLSIGFIVAVLITVLGFFLYNFLSIKKRLLNFGIMRSIGLSLKQLISILALEQILSVGIAFVLGTVFGIVTSRIFLPFLQISEELADTIPGFRPVVETGDILKILVILGGTLVIGLVVLGIIFTKLKLHEAIQLGEEI